MDTFVDDTVVDNGSKLTRYLSANELVELYRAKWLQKKALIHGSIKEKFVLVFGYDWSYAGFAFESDFLYERDIRYALLSKKVSDMPKGKNPTDLIRILHNISNAELERQLKIPWKVENRIVARAPSGYCCIMPVAGDDIGYISRNDVIRELNRRKALKPKFWAKKIKLSKVSPPELIQKFKVKFESSSREDLKKLLSTMSRVSLADLHYSDWSSSSIMVLGEPLTKKVVFPQRGDTDKWPLLVKEKTVWKRLNNLGAKGDLLDKFLSKLNMSVKKLLSSDLRKDSQNLCYFIYHADTNEVVYSFSYPVGGLIDKKLVSEVYKERKLKPKSFLRELKPKKKVKIKFKVRLKA